jgi:tRNA G18 (ribose-2'-O)-methylase SpoU
MGSHRHLNFLYFRNCIEAIHFLKEKHVFCLALETSLKSTSIDKWVINNNHMKSQSLAIFLGNERFGLSYNCLTQVDALVAIPAKGFKNSLNVSVAAGIAMNYFSD